MQVLVGSFKTHLHQTAALLQCIGAGNCDAATDGIAHRLLGHLCNVSFWFRTQQRGLPELGDWRWSPVKPSHTFARRTSMMGAVSRMSPACRGVEAYSGERRRSKSRSSPIMIPRESRPAGDGRLRSRSRVAFPRLHGVLVWLMMTRQWDSGSERLESAPPHRAAATPRKLGSRWAPANGAQFSPLHSAYIVAQPSRCRPSHTPDQTHLPISTRGHTHRTCLPRHPEPRTPWLIIGKRKRSASHTRRRA